MLLMLPKLPMLAHNQMQKYTMILRGSGFYLLKCSATGLSSLTGRDLHGLLQALSLTEDPLQTAFIRDKTCVILTSIL